jgi:hypothetical protein
MVENFSKSKKGLVLTPVELLRLVQIETLAKEMLPIST